MQKLLIVDDNFMDREGLLELIDWESFGFSEVFFAKDGQDGLNKAKEVRPALVLSDISMPIMDGLTMAGKIQAILPDTRFIFMSCFEEKEYMIKAIGVNAYGYILKPIQIEQLTQAVEKVMNIVETAHRQQEYILSIETELSEYIPYVQENILRDMCYGNLSAKDSQEQMRRFGLDKADFFALVAVSVDLDKPDESGYLYVYKMKDIAQSLAQKSNITVKSVILDHKTLLLYLMIDEKTADSALEESVLFAEVYNAQVSEKTGRQFFISIGSVENDTSKLPKSFKEVKTALDFEVQTKTTGLVMATELESASFMERLNLQELKNELTEIIDSAETEKITSFTEEYLSADYERAPEVYKQILLSIVSVLQMILYERGESFERIFDNAFSIWERILNPEHILDMRQWIINIIKVVSQHLDKQKKEYYNDLVEQIKELISTDYARFENVSEITEHFYMSKNHLNVIFKRLTGENIFDYLMKMRIKYAKEMLTETDMRVYEISEKIGYKSTAYFTSVFKSHTGQTPKEYRMMHKIIDA